MEKIGLFLAVLATCIAALGAIAHPRQHVHAQHGDCCHKCPSCGDKCGKNEHHAQNGGSNAEKEHACAACGHTWR